MKSRPFIFFLSLLMVLFVLPVYSEDEPAPAKRRQIDLPTLDIFSDDPSRVEAVADELEYSKDNKTIIAKGNVVIRYQDNQLTADYGEVDTVTKKVFAKGHVIVFHKGQPIGRGEEIHYDFNSHSGDFGTGQAVTFPWFIRGDDIQQVRQGVKTVDNASISTCNLEKPHYDIRAKKVTIHDNDKMVARNIKIYILGKPVFWWPYLVIPLNQYRTVPVSISAGHTSRHGYFVYVTKGFSITKNIGGNLQADWRSKRGFGGGGELNYNFGKTATGIIKAYWTQDRRAPSPKSDSPFGELQDRDRGRITWLHRTDIDPYTNVLFRYNRLADEFFLQEFFQKESRAEIEPQSFVTATRNSERFGFYTHVEKRMNPFEAIVQKLPELKFDWKEQQLGKSPFFYENEFSYANLSSTLGRSKLHEAANRFDTFHQLSAPLHWNDINFTPFTDLRGTYYSRNRYTGTDRFRAASGIGTDIRTHFYRTYPEVFDKWGIEVNQLRHIIEPSFQYRSEFTNLNPEKISHFDTTDRVENKHSVTFGIENRLQTKRIVAGKMQRVDIVSLNTFLSYELRRDDGPFSSFLTTADEGRTNGNIASRTGILTQELVLRPYNWLQYQMHLDYNMRRNEWDTINHDILFKFRRYKVMFGHRLIRDIGDIGGSNQFVFEGSVVINPLWKVGGYFRWDAERSGRDEWQISATRDLHDFLLDFGYNVRNSSIQNSNHEVFVNLHMKAFPILYLRSGNRSSFSDPRIGQTIAGANEIAVQPYSFDDTIAPAGTGYPQ